MDLSDFDTHLGEIVNAPRHKPKEICPNPNVFVSKDTHRAIAVPCNLWKCPVCAKRKAWKLKKRIDRAIHQRDVRHLILTIPDNSYNITDMFNNLRTQLRERGKCKSYFWVKEFQERGVRHLHVILFEYIHYTEIKTYWEGNIKIKLVKGSASYLTKYLSKTESQELFEKGERRYSSSRNFFEKLIKFPSTEEWVFYTQRQLYEDPVFADRVYDLLKDDPNWISDPVYDDSDKWKVL